MWTSSCRSRTGRSWGPRSSRTGYSPTRSTVTACASLWTGSKHSDGRTPRMPTKISASLAAAPLVDLRSVARELEEGGTDMIHFDVEDGSFVPAMNLGTKIIRDLRPLTPLPFDVHLMMRNPEWIIPELARCGANRVAVHAEACAYPRRVLGLIDAHRMQAGLAFNPGTAIPPLAFCLPYLAFVVVLTTEPEISHSDFLPAVLSKVVEGKKQA